jgi:hypothetical protein
MYKYFLMALLLAGCRSQNSQQNEALKDLIDNESSFSFVRDKALEIVKTGFNAGDGYGEVWIRDYNTFIELSAEVYPKETLKENLLVFFRLQRVDGNIVDGFIPQSKARESEGGYDYIYTELEPTYCGHKNTVETDQETSLVQTVYKYVNKTGDWEFLQEEVGGRTVAERLEWALEYLYEHRWSDQYALIWGATTADWGDVQHCHPWGVFLTEDTKYSIDIYDNAMLLIAIRNLIDMVPEMAASWQPKADRIAENTMKHLWDAKNQKFIPHLYIDGSPFSEDFNENEIYYHGGTAVAIEAGLLSEDQVKVSLEKMKQNVEMSGAASIGLTLYPAYPEGSFENKGMGPYSYQNGGDWTWFGGRMIQQLIAHGHVAQAYREILPMVERVERNDGFFEWYTVANEPKGSGLYRGSAGVLGKAIQMLLAWAEGQST